MTSKPKPQAEPKKAKKTLKVIRRNTIDQRELLGNLRFYDRQNLIWDLKVPASEKLVILALNLFADGNGECYPGLKTIEETCGLTRADRVIDRLVSKGLITNYSRVEKGRSTSNGYQILFKTLKALKDGIDTVSTQDRQVVYGGIDTVSTQDRQVVYGGVDTVSTQDRQVVYGGIDTVSDELDHSELIQLTNPEELDQLTPERGREEFSHSKEIDLSEPEDFGMRSDFVVQQTKIASLTQEPLREDDRSAAPKNLVGSEYSAMGPIDVVYVAAVVTTGEPYSSSGGIDTPPNGFAGFKAVYGELCDDVGGLFGSVEVAREAWRMAWRGLEPPEDFWTGLTLYSAQQKNEFLRTGKCWTLGARRFLEDEKWRSALRIDARDQRAAVHGVDFHNPELIRKEALIASNKRNFQLAIEQGLVSRCS